MSDRSMPKITAILIRARQSIEKPHQWLQGHTAQHNGLAWRRCAIGAVNYAARQMHRSPNGALAHLARTLDHDVRCRSAYLNVIAAFNDRDTTEHGDVLNLIDTAIAKSMETANVE